MTKQDELNFSNSGLGDFGVYVLLNGKHDKSIVSDAEIIDDPFESLKKLLAVARAASPIDRETTSRVWNCQIDIVGLLFFSQNIDEYSTLLQPEDKTWLLAMAHSGTEYSKMALTILLIGMTNRFEPYSRNIVDRKTKEKFTITLYHNVEGAIFASTPDEQRELYDMLANKDGWESYFEVDGLRAVRLLHIYTKIRYLDMLLMLAEEYGLKDAYKELGDLYYIGGENRGIFVNYQKAKEYYDKGGIEYDPEDFKSNEWDSPHVYDYTLKGNADTIHGIRTMIEDLCNKYGTPGNELGLYVPLPALMKLLVGSTYYRGNIIRMEQPSPDCLLIHAEHNAGIHLLCAFRECFENLEITMEEKEIF